MSRSRFIVATLLDSTLPTPLAYLSAMKHRRKFVPQRR